MSKSTIFSICAIYLLTPVRAEIIYVDRAAAAPLNGTSWEHAFVELQDALAAAAEPDSGITEIRVAQGVYRPDRGGGQIPGNREAAFRLVDGVALRGGYGGLAAEDPDERSFEAFVTVLSGDLRGDDGLDFAGNGENSYHVVLAEDSIIPTALEGFTVRGGNADGPVGSATGTGGGVYIVASALDIRNCRLVGNSATEGGGLFTEAGSPALTRCTLAGNRADDAGGGMYASGGEPVLTACTFSDNWTLLIGGGLAAHDGSRPMLAECVFQRNVTPIDGGAIGISNGSNPTLIRCTFAQNEAMDGGAVAAFVGTSGTLTDCRFIDNRAGRNGGAVYNNGSALAFTNGVFRGNTAYAFGGGINVGAGNPSIVNCTFYDNRALFPHAAGYGGALFNTNGQPALANCILWGNYPDTLGGGFPDVTFSDVEGGHPGMGNFDLPPGFMDPDGDDLRLSLDSPCINTGTDAAVSVETDLDGRPRIQCFRVDRGAYETGAPAQRGDFDSDGDFDLADVAGFQLCQPDGGAEDPWSDGCRCLFDFDNSQTVDLVDFSLFHTCLQPANAAP